MIVIVTLLIPLKANSSIRKLPTPASMTTCRRDSRKGTAKPDAESRIQDPLLPSGRRRARRNEQAKSKKDSELQLLFFQSKQWPGLPELHRRWGQAVRRLRLSRLCGRS